MRDRLRRTLAGMPLTAILTIAIIGGLSGCAALPSSGPSGRAIKSAEKGAQNTIGFKIVEVQDVQSLPPSEPIAAAPLIPPGPIEQSINMIGIGDGLQIVVYEAGVALFSGTARSGVPSPVADTGSAKAETLPPILVDETGYISIPYAGRIHAAGMTTYELQRTIAAKLAGKSQDPQVLVTIASPVANAIIMGGEIARPGRLVLATGRETLSQAIALAGGYKGEALDLIARLERGVFTVEERVSRLPHSPIGSLKVAGGDNIQILRQPMTFSSFGGPGKIDLFPFGKDNLSLAEAVARAGGSSQYAGDPAAIFVFRYVQGPDGDKPVIYHLNMMKTAGYFLAQRFAMRDGDVLYVGNAAANQPSKLIQIIGQIFTPLALARTVAQ